MSLRQAITPERMQGRMNATMRWIVWGTIPVGGLLGGILGTAIGLRPTILLAAIGTSLVFLPVLLSEVRSIRAMPWHRRADCRADGLTRPCGPRPPAYSPSSHREPDAALPGHLERPLVAGVGVAQDARARVGRQDALQLVRREVGAVRHDDHAGMLGVADPDAAAVVDAHPGRPGGGVDQGVEERPVRDRIRPVAHRLRLAVRRGDGAGVEVVAPDDDRARTAHPPGRAR